MISRNREKLISIVNLFDDAFLYLYGILKYFEYAMSVIIEYYEMNPQQVQGCSNEPLKIRVVTHLVLTTNECNDLPYFASICQDMYLNSMSCDIVTIPYTKMKCAKYGELRQNKALQEEKL